MAKVSLKAKEVLEKAIAKQDVSTWQFFDYVDLLIKQKALKFKGSLITKFILIRNAEGRFDVTDCEFFVGSKQYSTVFSKLDMPTEARDLIKKSLDILYKKITER
nr:MAG TPA: hypothetical protein [Caudoviricetes sp.]